VNCIFVSAPYTGTESQKLYRNHTIACYIADLMNDGFQAYSPVVFGHAINEISTIPTDYPFWKEHCTGFMKMCTQVHVLMIDGWVESTGVQDEIKIAEDLGIPVIKINKFSNAMFNR